MTESNLRPFPPRSMSSNGGNGIENRLGKIEGDIREIKIEMKHLATREWILWKAIVLLFSAIGLAVTIASGLTFVLLRQFGS